MTSRWALYCLALALTTLTAAAAQERKSELAATRVTLHADSTSVAEALKRVEEQSKINLADRRIKKDIEKIDIDLQNVPFWQAVDEIARKAGGAVSIAQPDKVIALVDGKPRTVKPSYGSIFRGVVKRIALIDHLDIGVHHGKLDLEFAWEPWWQPFFLEVKSWQATFSPDNKGETQVVTDSGTGKYPVADKPSLSVPLSIPAPPRSVQSLQSLRGELSVIGAKMLEIVFDKLDENAKPQTRMHNGVSVTLNSFRALDKKRWLVNIELVRPPGATQFESFQSWTENNKIWLQHRTDPKKKFIPPDYHHQCFRKSSNEVLVQGLFFESENNPPLGDPSDWKLVYRTPGPFVEVGIPFEFKNIPLP